MTKTLLYFVAFLLLSQLGLAQGYLSLSGKIVDAQTKAPIANAYIGLLKRGTGIITNDDGQFVYRFPRIAADSVLVVAVAGYRTFQQKASSFSPNQKDVLILLEAARPQVVDSGFIKRFEARELVAAALRKVKANASPLPYLLTGFYTETLQQNGEYIEIKEAILQSEKDPRPKATIAEKTKLVKNRPRRLFVSERRIYRYTFYGYGLARIFGRQCDV
jgi:CarboxypepD_reg-like domain